MNAEQMRRWPLLAALPRENVGAQRAGDAVAFISSVMVAATPNRSERPRWTQVLQYAPQDVKYVGYPSPITDGLGLQPNQRLEHPRFRVVYEGDPAKALAFRPRDPQLAGRETVRPE
jgi:ectoine hydroxylase-related dioxygenase (phytanoyl-CoA dioxygenase family)